jgi:hypothetical protein
MARRSQAIALVAAAAFVTLASTADATTIDFGSTTLGRADGLIYREAQSQTVTVGVSRGAGAECPRHRETTGGGAVIPGSSGFIESLSDSSPLPTLNKSRFWVGTFTYHGGGGNSVEAIAICGKLAHRKLVQKTDTAVSSTTTLRAPCPHGMEVSGGGVSFSTDDGSFTMSAPYDSGDADQKPNNGWKVTVNPPAPTDVTVTAVCVEGLKLAYRSRTIGPFSDTDTEAQAPCKSGEAVAGGGGSFSGTGPGDLVMGTVPYDFAPPKGPNDGWAYLVHIGPMSRQVTAFAICKKSSG